MIPKTSKKTDSNTKATSKNKTTTNKHVKAKILFTQSNSPTLSKLSLASGQYFWQRIKNKDIDTKQWAMLWYFDNKLNHSVIVHLWTTRHPADLNKKFDPDHLQEQSAKAVRYI